MLTDSHADHVGRFFQHIEPWSRAFRSRTFHYFGVATGDEIHLCAARIRLQLGRPPPRRAIDTGRLRAGVIAIPGRRSRVREIVEALVSGAAVTIGPGLVVRLPTDSVAGMHVAPPMLLHPEGLSGGRRLSVLTIQAGQWSIGENRIDLDWSLKTAREPYDGLAELLRELGLAEHASQRYTLDVVALPPVEVSVRSAVRGEEATVGIWMPKGLNKGPASLHYRILSRNAPTVRASLPARQLTWTRDANANIGTTEIRVPRGAVVNCVASYASVGHHSYWFADPAHIPNPRVQALTATDAALEALKATLTSDAVKGSAAKQFETAVAAVVWAYGLAPVQTDYAEQTKDGPDLVAVAPGGGVAVIECTVGLLKAQNKLANLARRAVVIRERMQSAALVPPTVLPVIVSRLRRAEVEAELDAATEAGVLVLTRENLEAAMNEALLLKDGDAVFRQGLEAVERARADLAAKRGQASAPAFA
jgi:hypothetical protein